MDTRVLMIGPGKQGSNIARRLKQENVLVGMLSRKGDFSVVEQNFSKAGLSMEGIRRYPLENLDEALAEVQAVAIATPSSSHAQYIKAALDAGKHVYVEKPLCWDDRLSAEDNAQQSHALLQQAKEKGLYIGGGSQYYTWFNNVRNPFYGIHNVTHLEGLMATKNPKNEHTTLMDMVWHLLTFTHGVLGYANRKPGKLVDIGYRTDNDVELTATLEAPQPINMKFILDSTKRPREVAFTVNGERATRWAENLKMGEAIVYTSGLDYKGRRIELGDPTPQSVSDFVAALQGKPYIAPKIMEDVNEWYGQIMHAAEPMRSYAKAK